MTQYQNLTLDAERALYGVRDVLVEQCCFDGPADGESALKECRDITVRDCFFNLRYPFWHDRNLVMERCELTPLCRAALWYDDQVELRNCKLHGIKALRECANVHMVDCDVESAEFAWCVRDLSVRGGRIVGEYFGLNGANITMDGVDFKGKYSFQYVRGGELTDCNLDTKDAFWHSSHVTVCDSVVKGEYLGWYSDHLTLIHCTIIGTQPLCYCTNLKLVDCKMVDTDLSFEKSCVEATLTAPIVSIKNPLEGTIRVPACGEVVLDDPQALEGCCRLIIGEAQ